MAELAEKIKNISDQLTNKGAKNAEGQKVEGHTDAAARENSGADPS